MTFVGVLLAGGGSATGSVARYTIGRTISNVSNSGFPWGTWIVNMVGTFLFGLFFQEFSVFHHDPDWYVLLGRAFAAV